MREGGKGGNLIANQFSGIYLPYPILLTNPPPIALLKLLPSHFRPTFLYLFAHGSTLIRGHAQRFCIDFNCIGSLGPSSTLHPPCHTSPSPSRPFTSIAPSWILARICLVPYPAPLLDPSRTPADPSAHTEKEPPTSSHFKSRRVLSKRQVRRAFPLMAINPS